MTKKEFLENALKGGGLKGNIYTSMKELKHATGTQYGAVLRAADRPVRASSKKTYRDQEGATIVRNKLYECETVYNVVIAGTSEEIIETILEGFLANLGKGYYDAGGNWVEVTPKETDWVDEDDCVMKSKIAVQIQVNCRYGIYRDKATDATIEGADIQFGGENDE